MEKSVVVSKKRNRRRGNVKIRPAFTLYPNIPSKMKVNLRARTYETASAAISPLYFRYGLFEFLGRTGNYSDSLFGLYKYAIIYGGRIRLRAVNTGSEPLILAVAPLPYGWVGSTPTVGELLDNPRCVRATIGSNSGMDKVEIVNTATAKQLLGSDLAALRYQQDQAQASSSTPVFNEEPCWTAVCTSFNGLSTVSFRIEVEIEYNVQFFNLDSS